MAGRGRDPEEDSLGARFESGGEASLEDAGDLSQLLKRAEQERKYLAGRLEFETVHWDSERRRLRAEIDDLRRAADQARQQAGEIEQLRMNLEESRRRSQRLESRCEEQTARATSEAERLQKRIEELENQVVALLDAANNSHRAKLAADRRMEEAITARKRALEMDWERKAQIAEAQWARERQGLELEIERLRRSPVERQPRTAPPQQLSDRGKRSLFGWLRSGRR